MDIYGIVEENSTVQQEEENLMNEFNFKQTLHTLLIDKK